MLKRIYIYDNRYGYTSPASPIYIYTHTHTFEVTTKREKDERKTNGLSCNCFSGLPTLFSLNFLGEEPQPYMHVSDLFIHKLEKKAGLSSTLPLLYVSKSRCFVMASKSYHWSNLGIIFRVLFCFFI